MNIFQNGLMMCKRLRQLRFYSLTCISKAFGYDEVVVPNLRRMINLERLALYFVTDRRRTFIQGSNLKRSIFIFNIRSMVFFSDLVYFPSNEDIHRTFTTLKNCEIVSSVDYFSKEQYGQCHIYSSPYTL